METTERFSFSIINAQTPVKVTGGRNRHNSSNHMCKSDSLFTKHATLRWKMVAKNEVK